MSNPLICSTNIHDIDVIIVGGGPAGLALSGELARFNINCLLLEKKTERSCVSKAFNLTPYTLELLGIRGLAEKLIAHGYPCRFAPLGDGKNYLDFQRLETKHPYILSVHQEKTEEILEQWSLEAKARIIEGAHFINFKQNKNEVIVTYEKDNKLYSLSTKYLIGCDGAYSKVRELSGIKCDETVFHKSLMHGDVHLKTPPKEKIFARTSHQGMIALFPFKNDTYRLLVLDHSKMHIPVDEPVSLSEFQESAFTLAKKDFGIHTPLWLNRFKSQQKHAIKYRDKRVFLLGDAAHTHMPAGGQGLQMCIQAAFNLGWKLAMVIRENVSDKLLDSYEEERRPLIQVAMRRSIIMFRYEISRDVFSKILKWLANKVLLIAPLQKFFLKDLCGLNIKYNSLRNNIDDQPSITGRRIEDYQTTTLSGTNDRLYKVLLGHKLILVTHILNTDIHNYIKTHCDNIVNYIISQDLTKKNNIEACLIRPDGFVMWATNHITIKLLDNVLKSRLDF